MSANVLGIQLDDHFQPHSGAGPSCSQNLTTYATIEEPTSFCGRVWQPYIEDGSLQYQRKQYPICSSSPSREQRQTVQQLQSWNTDVVNQMRARSWNWTSGYHAHQLNSPLQKLQVSACNQPQDPEVSSSFSPYTQYGHYSGHPLATHQSYQSVNKSDSSGPETPTVLSLRKHVLENERAENTKSQSTFSGQNESRKFTYTHLSDVSDSDEDVCPNSNIPKKFNRSLAKRKFERLRPYQLALPLLCTYPVMEAPATSTFDPVATYPQIAMNPEEVPVAASNRDWRLQQSIEDNNELSQKKEEPKIIELQEDSVDKHKDSVHNGTSSHVKPADEEGIIDLSKEEDDIDVGFEQLKVQPTQSDEVPAEIQNLEGITQQSSIIAVDSVISPEKDDSGTQQDNLVSQHPRDASPTTLLPESPDTQKHLKRPCRKLKSARNRQDCSRQNEVRRSPRIRSMARRNGERHNSQAANRCVVPSQPRRSPRLQRRGIECATTTKVRSREPWYHKGLVRFIAEYAFKLPTHIWKQKAGEPRRSNRLAKKIQRKRYLLRARSRTNVEE